MERHLKSHGDNVLNLTETTKRLKIGKIKLYELLEITGIDPLVKGRSKFISEEQFILIEKAFRSSKSPQNNSQYVSESVSQNNSQYVSDSDQSSELMKTLSSEIEHLRNLLKEERNLLKHEQNERQAEREERTNYQQMLGALQQNNQRLQQEIKQLQLNPPGTPTVTSATESTESTYRSNVSERNEVPRTSWFSRIFAS